MNRCGNEQNVWLQRGIREKGTMEYSRKYLFRVLNSGPVSKVTLKQKHISLHCVSTFWGSLYK